jgi:hypothetical protein
MNPILYGWVTETNHQIHPLLQGTVKTIELNKGMSGTNL